MPTTLTTPQRRFSLRAIFLATTALAVVFTIVAQIPRSRLQHAITTAPVLLLFTALLALAPLTVANLVCVVVSRILSAATRSRVPGATPQKTDAELGRRPSHPPRLHVLLPHRLLWQAGATEPPTWAISVTIAISCTLAAVLLWSLLREFGLTVALMGAENIAAGMPTLKEIPKLMATPSFLWRLWHWELFSIARWWYVFSLLMMAWILVTWPWRDRLRLEPISVSVRRLLAFAPWIVVLEVAFLAGVWTLQARVVPEPSTGFVEGIFSWDLWHWDCWKGRTWISRGLIPTFTIGTLFLMAVLRWRWTAAIAAAACLVPPTLMLSVAWMVLYSYGLP